jgi:zinc transport system substrate-binding protein
MKRSIIAIICILMVSSLAARGNDETAPSTVTIATSILPHQYVVDRIAGDFAESMVLVGPGQSPHSYEPSPRQMAQLSQSQAWITSGTDFETALVPKISSLYPSLTIIDGTAGVQFRYLDEHHEEDDHEHEENGTKDPHTWLGREPMKLFAQHVTDTLVDLDHEHADIYRKNLEAFHQEIDQLYDRLGKELENLAGSTVFVYHPSFGYLFDEFSITQRAVETGGREPTAQALTRLIALAQQEKPPAIFVQSQFPVQAAQSVAKAIGAKVLALDPLAYDWSDNIARIGEILGSTLISNQ